MRTINKVMAILSPAPLLIASGCAAQSGDSVPAPSAMPFAIEDKGTFDSPWAMAFAPGTQVLFITEKPGTMKFVDLASGRAVLVERMVAALDRPIIATDFSPRILRRNRRWLEHWGRYDRVSLLAFDARRTPFKNGALATLTTNLGLPNIEEPARLLGELRRIISRTLLAVSQFYPEDDAPNGAAIQAARLATMLYRRATLAAFAAAGWRATLEDRCLGHAEPTPVGVVIEGAGIDGLPVAATTLEWGIIVAQ